MCGGGGGCKKEGDDHDQTLRSNFFLMTISCKAIDFVVCKNKEIMWGGGDKKKMSPKYQVHS